MSSKKRITTWQRELYQRSYRWIRSFDTPQNGGLLDSISIGTDERQAIFGRALISFENRKYRGYCWQNPLCEREFRTKATYRPEWDGIPF